MKWPDPHLSVMQTLAPQRRNPVRYDFCKKKKIIKMIGCDGNRNSRGLVVVFFLNLNHIRLKVYLFNLVSSGCVCALRKR